MKRVIRYTLCGVATVFGLLLLWEALTVPMVSAAGPAILAVALLVLAYFLYPRKARRNERDISAVGP